MLDADLLARIARAKALLGASRELDADLESRLTEAWHVLHGHRPASAESVIAASRKGMGGAARWWCDGCGAFSSGPATQCGKCRHIGATFSECSPMSGNAARKARLRSARKRAR